MKVSGGFDTEFPVAVVSVEETSPAHGRIKEGDLLWSLDGVQLQGLDHQQVWNDRDMLLESNIFKNLYFFYSKDNSPKSKMFFWVGWIDI